MPRADPVLIFDLDGTILSRNSFPYWVRALLTGGGRGGLHARLSLSWQVQRLLLQRKLGGLGHDAFLREMQRLWQVTEDSTGKAAARLQSRLLRLVRANLRPVLKSVADLSVDSVLATAAAADYAEPLARELGFLNVLATPPAASTAQPCNRGQHKCDRVLAFLDNRGWEDRPRIFFNDHMDDVPLMQVSHAVCWFGGRKDMAAASKAAPNARFVPCRSLSAEEMRQMLAHLQLSLQTTHLAGSAPFAAARASTLS